MQQRSPVFAVPSFNPAFNNAASAVPPPPPPQGKQPISEDARNAKRIPYFPNKRFEKLAQNGRISGSTIQSQRQSEQVRDALTRRHRQLTESDGVQAAKRYYDRFTPLIEAVASRSVSLEEALTQINTSPIYETSEQRSATGQRQRVYAAPSLYNTGARYAQ